jgi:hypothetical protein
MGSTGIVILIILAIGISGFLFANGTFEFNPEKFEQSVNRIPEIVPQGIIDDVTKSIPLNSIENVFEDISDKIPLKTDEIRLSQKTYSESELKQITIDWDYNDILRNTVEYRGKIIHVEGPIDRTERIADDKFRFLVLSNPHKFPTPGKHNYVMIDHVGQGFVNGDVIELWGTVDRVDKLDTLFGAEQLMPVIKSIKINCIQCR